MQLRQFYVYIMTNRHNRVLYIGITYDLRKRVYEHKSGQVAGFTEQYNVIKLVYYEVWNSAEAAIAREKQLKKWHRDWKLNLIKELNPDLDDLSEEL